MFFGDSNKGKQTAKWIIRVVTTCILIYLIFSHIGTVADAISWLANLIKPLIVGTIIALILNVPMSPIEKHLFQKNNEPKIKKVRRSVAIVLSVILVFGIFLGIAFLVIPEFLDAVPLVGNNVSCLFEQIASQEHVSDIDGFSVVKLLAKLDLDWNGIKQSFNTWFENSRSSVVNYAMGTIAKISSTFVNLALGLVFAIYILYSKEKLKVQVERLIKAWLPENFGQNLIHIATVFNKTFKGFISGQTIEAIIIGVLCTVGMFILHLPYAPMVGTLVGVTALIPIVGAWIGTIFGAFIIITVEPFKALIFVVFIVILQQIEGDFIYPRVVGSSIGLPSIWVLASITVGGRLAGPLGMFLGVPAVSALYRLLKEFTEWKEGHVSDVVLEK